VLDDDVPSSLTGDGSQFVELQPNVLTVAGGYAFDDPRQDQT
jgi:hypothetical protein